MINKILVLILVLILCFLKYEKFENNIQFKNNNNIELVISRYNESLNWVNNEPFNKYPIICYNKGSNTDFIIKSKNKIVNLPNIGRCDHTYLYHIINNYDNLANVTLFLTGSLDLEHKYNKALKLINEIEKYNNTVFLVIRYENDIKTQFYNFTLDKWKASSLYNTKINDEENLEKSRIRPFGKWYEHHFGDIKVNYVSFLGIFAISRKHILQHSKKYYIKLIEEFNNSSNPEVGHYFERAWNAVFYPLDDAKFIINSI
jgi:hypothetical protein